MILKNDKKFNTIFTLITFLVFAIIFFLLNNSTVLQWNDDFSYSNAKSIKDVFSLAFNEYFNWNGRVFTNIVLRLMLMLDKNIFNIFNTIIFILLNYLVVWYSTYGIKISQGLKVVLFTFSIFLTIFFIPDQDVLFWVVGSINYIWPATLLLFTFSIFFKLIIDSIYSKTNKMYSKKTMPLVLTYSIYLTAIMSGNSNENSSLAVLIMMILSIIYFKINNIKYDKNMIIVIILFSISYLLLFFSPGAHNRSMIIAETSVSRGLYDYLIRAFSLLFRYYEQFLVMNTLYIVLLSYTLYNGVLLKNRSNIKIKDVYLTICLYLFSLFSNFVLIFSPLQPERAKTFAFLLLLISILRLISICLSGFKFVKPIIISLYTGLLILLIPLNIVVINSLIHKRMFDNDVKYINELKNNGEKDITIIVNRESIIDKKNYKIPERIKNLTSFALITEKYASILGVDKIIIK